MTEIGVGNSPVHKNPTDTQLQPGGQLPASDSAVGTSAQPGVGPGALFEGLTKLPGSASR